MTTPGTAPRWPLLAVVVGVLAVSNVVVNVVLMDWLYVPWNLAVAGVLLVLARRAGISWADLGLGRATLRRSAMWGLVGVATIVAVYAAALALPATRALFEDARADDRGWINLAYHALVQIPLGTVVLEELAFRGVLPAAFGARNAGSWQWRPVLAASALFGLWHVLPSAQLATGNEGVSSAVGGSLVITALLAVLATGVAGIVLCWWRWMGRGLLTPVCVHVATNSLGFVVAWVVTH